MDLPGDVPVTLVIKAPNQRMEDQTVDCMLGWTIRKLKQHLEAVYPSKPKHSEQRLIYSGRLLQDHLTLKEILRQYDDSEIQSKHTVHLVCSRSQDVTQASPATSSTAQHTKESSPTQGSSQSSPATPLSTDSSSHQGPTQVAQGEGLRYRGHGQPPTASPVASGSPTTYPTYQHGFVAGDPGSDYQGYPLSPEQYAWMIQQQQQMYSQYMLQYMQYYQSLYQAGQPFSPFMGASPFPQVAAAAATHPQQQQQQPQVDGAANNGGVRAGPPRPNVRMNAQGGMEEDDDDEGEPRDWLHHMYFFMRFLTFMGILFFYSNLTRFLVVFTGFVAIYILQKVRKYIQRAQREQEQQQQQQQQQQQPQPQQNEPQQPQQQQQQVEQNSQAEPAPDQAPADSDRAPQGEGVVEEGQQQAPAEDEGGRLAQGAMFVWNTIQTFFTSLLPTPPELLEAN